MADKLFKLFNVSQIVQVSNTKAPFLKGEDQSKLAILNGPATIVMNSESGRIEWIGLDSETPSIYDSIAGLNCANKAVVPGFVDGHTHPVWSGDRVHEFALKLQGATYMEIHQQGGGIGFTVNATRQAPQIELEALLEKRVNCALKNGTTTMEAKSGYGLETETEIKMLKAIHNVNKRHPVDLVSTYLGAHSVPKTMTCQEYTQQILTQQLPKLKELIESKELQVANIDVFCEKGVFGVDETREILKKGREMGLKLNFHGDELTPMKSGQLGGELAAEAISHLECLDDEGIQAMAIKPTVAVLLPTTAYILRLEVPPARKMIEGGVPVALGSDFNPNAHCISMPFVMNLACVTMKMNMNEALVGATLNAAASLGMSADIGSLEVGKFADCVIVDAPKWEHLIYQMADPPIFGVVKKGVIAYQKSPQDKQN